ncbi:MAG: alpha/beta hydrolase [Pseudomonadota bacterium]
MTTLDRDEAVGFIISAVDEDHDGLVSFSEKIQGLDSTPAFWLRDYPVYVRPLGDAALHPWPILPSARSLMALPGRTAVFELPRKALADTFQASVGASLTEAEAALLFDLASGKSLEESAQEAGTAVSTRRKQLQHVFRKLDVGGQVELVSLTGRLLNQLVSAADDLNTQSASTWEPYADHLPEGARYGVIGGSDGQTVRYLELGPHDGTPVLVLHPMVFPHLSEADVALFHELGWRTLWPLRPGCLGFAAHHSKGWDAHCKASVEAIAALHRLAGGGAMPVISLVSGGAYAVRFAEAYPGSVSRIDFVSTCFSAGKNKSRDVYFGDAFLRSVRQNGRMAVAAVQHLGGILSRGESQRQKIARKVFGDCRVDQHLLDEEFSTPKRQERFSLASLHSMDSMRHDYLAQVHFSWREAAALPVPKVFWHGAQDRVHNVDDLKQLAQSVTGTASRVLPDMGHLTQGAPLRDVFRQIAADLLQME